MQVPHILRLSLWDLPFIFCGGINATKGLCGEITEAQKVNEEELKRFERRYLQYKNIKQRQCLRLGEEQHSVYTCRKTPLRLPRSSHIHGGSSLLNLSFHISPRCLRSAPINIGIIEECNAINRYIPSQVLFLLCKEENAFRKAHYGLFLDYLIFIRSELNQQLTFSEVEICSDLQLGIQITETTIYTHASRPISLQHKVAETVLSPRHEVAEPSPSL